MPIITHGGWDEPKMQTPTKKFKLPHWLRHDWGKWDTFEIVFVSTGLWFEAGVEITKKYQGRKCETCGKYQQERISY